MRRRALRLLLPALVLLVCACKTPPSEAPDYTRPLAAGESALVRVGFKEPIADPAIAFRQKDDGLLEAIDLSLNWFEAPSSQKHFPFENIATHEQARASLVAFRELLTTAISPADFRTRLWEKFYIYRSVGWDRRGTVLYTGYYAPEFRGSRTQTKAFSHPLYRRPADLVTDPETGAPLGQQRPDGTVGHYPTRDEIEKSGMLEGTELVWVEDELAAYIIHVNGSAKLELDDGSTIYVGYDGKTDRAYTGLGTSLIEAGLVSKDKIGLPAVRDSWRRYPEKVRKLIRKNESYVFFTEYDGDNWPSGSLGVRVTSQSSLATDKRIYPRAGVVMVRTKGVTLSKGTREFHRFMVDQDTGGAIRAPGRADIYMGNGRVAEVLAGGQYAEGELYYFFLKPQFVKNYSAGATPEGE